VGYKYFEKAYGIFAVKQRRKFEFEHYKDGAIDHNIKSRSERNRGGEVSWK
jgi:hypothetical protein